MKQIIIKFFLLTFIIGFIIVPNIIILRQTSGCTSSQTEENDGENQNHQEINIEKYTDDEAENQNSYIEKDGERYLKINVAELYVKSQLSPDTFGGKNYVLRGVFFQNEELEKENKASLLRMMITCCFA
ncbi:MAG: hypothetical protein ACQESP_11795, partial [Candidatus Muiribacteriota bacterium]